MTDEKLRRVIEAGPWKTPSEFWTWVRGSLRRAAWMKHPVKLNHIKSSRYKAPLGRGGNEVWCCTCAICGETKRQSECQVDHISPAGSLKKKEDIFPFIEKLLFVTEEDIRILCKWCHSICTYAERYGMTFEQAKKRKMEIAKKTPIGR